MSFFNPTAVISPSHSAYNRCRRAEEYLSNAYSLAGLETPTVDDGLAFIAALQPLNAGAVVAEVADRAMSATGEQVTDLLQEAQQQLLAASVPLILAGGAGSYRALSEAVHARRFFKLADLVEAAPVDLQPCFDAAVAKLAKAGERLDSLTVSPAAGRAVTLARIDAVEALEALSTLAQIRPNPDNVSDAYRVAAAILTHEDDLDPADVSRFQRGDGIEATDPDELLLQVARGDHAGWRLTLRTS